MHNQVPEYVTDAKVLCKFLFNITLYEYQRRIIQAILDGNRKITIRATTRAGKSYSIAMAAVLYAVLKRNRSVGIVAPTYDKARKLMDYVAELLGSSALFDDIVMVNTEGMSQLERLRKEVSKKRITFKNGSSIEIKSVDLSSKGLAVMGSGYDLIIVEETAEIDDISYTKIYRMLVETPDSQLVEIGNPWAPNHFLEHHHDDDWTKIHISWRDCVSEGRMTQEAVADQRKEISELEFKVLFDADFPDEMEFAIFSQEALTKCTRKAEYAQFDKILVGVDVARGGRDRTVITVGGVSGKEISYIEHKVMDTRDIMHIVGRVRELIDSKYGATHKPIEITVDTVGIGAGVKDRLAELHYNVREFVAGRSARNVERFANLKTEVAFKVAEMMKDGKITNIPPDSKFILQFRSWTYEVRSDKQVKLIDPEKSPDESDSFLIMCANSLYNEEAQVIALERGTVYPNRPKFCNFLGRHRSIGYGGD